MKTAVPAFFFLVILYGCFGSRPANENILLYFDRALFAPAFPDKSPRTYPFKIQVRRLKVDPLYDNPKVIVRLNDYSVNYSRKGNWAIRPQMTASDLLMDFLKASFSFKAIRESFSDDQPDFIVSGDMGVVEEDLRDGQRAAVIALTLRVSQGRDDKIIYEETFRRNRPCEDYGYSALAREFSLGLADIYRSFVQSLDKILSRTTEEKSDASKG